MSALSLGSSVVAGESPDRISSFRTGTGAANPYPLVGPIVFNRIMYRPASGGDEFVELLNSATYPIALYDPLYPENRWRISGGIEYTFDSTILLEPGEKILIVPTNAPAFRLKYGLSDAIKIAGPYTNQLSNSGERIALFRPDPPQQPPASNAGLVPYILVEDVTYSPTAPWPTAADGTGAALLRRNPTLFADDPTSWTVDTLAPVPNLAAIWNGSTLTLQWSAVSDQQLVLESANTPHSTTWSQVALVAAGTSTHPVSATDSARFFRLRRP
jgi:hypothetical protein